MSEMQNKNLGGPDFASEIKRQENYPDFDNMSYVIHYCLPGFIVKNIEDESRKANDVTTVFVDTRPSKTKHPRKRFQNFRQSYMLSTDRIEINQSQPASTT